MELTVQTVKVAGSALRNTQRLASVRVFVYDPLDDDPARPYHLVGSLLEGLACLLSDEGKGKILTIEDPDTHGQVSLLRSIPVEGSPEDCIRFAFELCTLQADWDGCTEVVLSRNVLEEVKDLLGEKRASGVATHFGSV